MTNITSSDTEKASKAFDQKRLHLFRTVVTDAVQTFVGFAWVVSTNRQIFDAFRNAGVQLAELHVGYENVATWPDLIIEYSNYWDGNDPNRYRVEKMRYGKNGKTNDRSTIIYNAGITVKDTPEKAYDYVLGSRPAIDWLVDRYQVTTNTKSQIVNDPNDWATEHDNPSYILDLIGRVVTVSMRTLEIVDNLPSIEIGPDGTVSFPTPARLFGSNYL